ncbi:hypothetical protein BGZ99_002314 [Dissophora globulifera]|uniref:RRM domain-containing protein n=1 Tax=Dissophora globulifera TaxID=979702 RepID=A0A9P6RSK1_9FUNG|nr:hypothetical protein BGZ99_002314 [Dissophora globulifera]
MSQDTAPTTQVIVEEDGHKVFVGNLSFQTTEAELAELFSKPTPVLKANIITRGPRSLGFGFVAFETLEQAEVAAKTYHKTELGGREINVEVAKPRVERPPKAPKQPKGEIKEAAASPEAAADGAEVKPRTGRSARSRASRKNKNKARVEGEEGTAPQAAASNGEVKEGSGRRKRSGRRSGRKDANDNEEGAEGTSGANAGQAKSWAPRQVGPPSKTTVFVANLPFAMEDEGLKELFKDYKLASAHVVRHGKSGRSKGFGFVELVDEAEQLKAVEGLKGVQADGRELVINIAHSEEVAGDKADATAEATA